jgi:hypothetical protein
MRRRVNTTQLQQLEEASMPEWVDDFSAPLKRRLRRWNDWIVANYEPLIAARRQYEAEHPGFVFEALNMPDQPWDPDAI